MAASAIFISKEQQFQIPNLMVLKALYQEDYTILHNLDNPGTEKNRSEFVIVADLSENEQLKLLSFVDHPKR